MPVSENGPGGDHGQGKDEKDAVGQGACHSSVFLFNVPGELGRGKVESECPCYSIHG